jgi:hypothetical protein
MCGIRYLPELEDPAIETAAADEDEELEELI